MKFILKYILITSLLYAQNIGAQSLIDQLTQEYKNAKHDTTKVKLLKDIAWELQYSNPDTAITIGQKAFALASKIKWDHGMGTSLSEMGWYCYLKGDFKLGQDYCEKALKIFRKMIASRNKRVHNLGLLGKATALGNSASIDVAQGNYPRALEKYLQSLRIDERFHKENKIATTYLNMGGIYGNINNINMAEFYYNKALRIAEKTNNQQLISLLNGSIGNIHLYRKQYDKAIDAFLKGYIIAENAGQLPQAAVFCMNLGTCYVAKEEALKAMPYLEKALELQKQLNDLSSMPILYHSLAGAYIQLHQYIKAEKTLITGLKLADSIQALQSQQLIEKGFADLYTVTKQPKLALEHLKRYAEIKDSITSKENSRKQVQAEMQYEFDKSQAADKIRAEELAKRNKLKHEQEINTQKTYTYIGITGFAFMLVVAFVSMRASQQKKKDNQIIALQKQLVEEKQKEIVDSIYYASRIQRALLTSEKYITRNLNK